MYLETLIEKACAENSNISRKKIERKVKEIIGYEALAVEEKEELENDCIFWHDIVLAEIESWVDSMKQADEEYEERQILMAEFHPSNLN